MVSVGDSREVGWYSWDEWHHVRKLLYSFDDTSSQIKGINMVRIWKSRSNQRGFPVSIDLTAVLVAAYVGNSSCVVGNEYQAQMSSAMAIIRFVNGVTDQHQTGLYAQSVQLIADKINIPNWMVDLRHEATHAKLPGFDLLKSGLLIALDWLDVSYWEETASKLIEKEQNFSLNMNMLLGDYADNIIGILALDFQGNHKSIKEKNKLRQRKMILLENSLISFSKYLHLGNLKKFISILLQNGFFVMNQKQLGLLGIREFKCKDKIDNVFINHIIEFSNLWKPLFEKLLQSFSSFMDLVISEIIAISKKEKLSDTSHAFYIIAIYALFKCIPTCSEIFLNYLLKKPSCLTFQIASLIVVEGEMSDGYRKKVHLFLDIFRPVLSALTSNSRLWESRKLTIMETEASLKGNKLIDEFKKEMSKPSLYQTNTCASWSHTSESTCLPPLGEFSTKMNLFYLDADNCSMDISQEEPIIQNLIEGLQPTNFDQEDMNDVLEETNIDYLVLPSIQVDKSKSELTKVDEDVDFDIQEKYPLSKTCFGSNFSFAPSKNIVNCNTSEIFFF